MPIDQLADYIARHYDSIYLVPLSEKYDANTWNMAMCKAVCKIKGHDYLADVFDSGCLYFCKRCGVEIAGIRIQDMDSQRIEELYQAFEMGR